MLSKSQERLFVNLSRRLDIVSNYRHVCVLLKQNTPVATGANDTRSSHPLAKMMGYRYGSVHAEFMCLVGYVCRKFKVKSRDVFKHNLRGYSLYSIRADRSGRLCNAKPCPICHALIRRLGIRHVMYTTTAGWERLSC
jgi:tRNA(Arg) A34 adenosine deaminase TadA